VGQTIYNYDPVGLRVGLTLPNGITNIFNALQKGFSLNLGSEASTE